MPKVSNAGFSARCFGLRWQAERDTALAWWENNIQHSTFNIQHSTFNIQHSTFNIQRSTFNAQSLTPRA
jgi:hypothetical protein